MRMQTALLSVLAAAMLAGCGSGERKSPPAEEGPPLLPILMHSKWGFIDRQGTVVVQPKFEMVETFSEDRARVQFGGLWGFIDGTGKLVVDFNFNNGAAFADGRAPVQAGEGWGYIDPDGKVVVPLRYQRAMRFSEGLGAVADGGAFGFMDPNGTLVIPPRFKNGGTFHDGRAVASEDGRHWGVIDRAGRFIGDTWYDQVQDFSEGLAAVKKDGLWGYIDTTGAVIIPPQWEYAGSLLDGRVRVGNPREPRWVYYDADGRIAIPEGYDFVLDFNEGLAPVRKNGNWGVIDRDNRVVVDFRPGSAFQGFSEGLCGYSEAGKWGYIDREGKTVIAPQFDEVGLFHDGIAPVRIAREPLYIDRTGKVLWRAGT